MAFKRTSDFGQDGHLNYIPWDSPGHHSVELHCHLSGSGGLYSLYGAGIYSSAYTYNIST